MRAVQPSTLRRALTSLGPAGVALSLAGCATVYDSPEPTAHAVSSPLAAIYRLKAEPVRLGVKTIKQQAEVEEPAVEPSAVPSPKEIFDFHPAGSRTDSWRQPFDIDLNDGPLAADVRKTAAELKAFNAEQKSGAAVAAHKTCSEMDVARDKPGCVGVKPKATATISRDPLAIQ